MSTDTTRWRKTGSSERTRFVQKTDWWNSFCLFHNGIVYWVLGKNLKLKGIWSMLWRSLIILGSIESYNNQKTSSTYNRRCGLREWLQWSSTTADFIGTRLNRFSFLNQELVLSFNVLHTILQKPLLGLQSVDGAFKKLESVSERRGWLSHDEMRHETAIRLLQIMRSEIEEDEEKRRSWRREEEKEKQKRTKTNNDKRARERKQREGATLQRHFHIRPAETCLFLSSSSSSSSSFALSLLIHLHPGCTLQIPLIEIRFDSICFWIISPVWTISRSHAFQLLMHASNPKSLMLNFQIMLSTCSRKHIPRHGWKPIILTSKTT